MDKKGTEMLSPTMKLPNTRILLRLKLAPREKRTNGPGRKSLPANVRSQIVNSP